MSVLVFSSQGPLSELSFVLEWPFVPRDHLRAFWQAVPE